MSADAAYGLLKKAITDAKRPVTLVLHRIDLLVTSDLESMLAGLLEHCESLVIAVTTSTQALFSDPTTIQVSYHRISADFLRFSADELRWLFDTLCIPASTAELELVYRTTGGLPALVDMATAVFERIPANAERVDLLGAAIEEVARRYTSRTVLSALAEPFLGYAVSVATASQLDADLARYLVPEADPFELLCVLETAGVLAQRETTRGVVWEFEPAIRTAVLGLQAEAGIPMTHRFEALASYYLERDDVANGLRFAAQAQQWHTVIELLEDRWVALIADELELLREILQAIPEALLDHHQPIKAGRALFTLLGSNNSGNLIALPNEPAQLYALGATSTAKDALSLGCVQSLMMRLTGDHTDAVLLTKRLAVLVEGILGSQPQQITGQLPVMRLQWGITYQLGGEFNSAATELHRAYHESKSADIQFAARNAAANMAMNDALVGEPARAQRWLAIAETHPVPDGWLGTAVLTSERVATAIAALDRFDVGTAARALAALGELPSFEELWPFVAYAHAQLALCTGESFTGLSDIQRAETHYPDSGRSTGIVPSLITAAKIDLRLAMGQGNRARQLIERMPENDGWCTIPAARTHLLAGNPSHALALCDRIDWIDHAPTRLVVEALLIAAVAHLALDNSDTARRKWIQASTLIDRTSLLRPLAALPRPAVERLIELTGTAPTGAEQVLTGHVRPLFPEAVPIVELSETEMLILTLLSSGASIRQIADNRFVSINTVKTQLRALYQKLGGHTRDQVLVTARSLGLIR
ncbi:LuxR C-terminal-related transcriptional regulator [Nocardia sp. NPDC051981]|uniref:helix-turn-helix transcriptional regulator n=1 Tax=Nocardia sp. NPDC051981 TaxID=3155417 RepID=UPI00343A15E8